MVNGDFNLPSIYSLETVLEYGIKLGNGRVFADVWDLGLFSNCKRCINKRINRLTNMNLSQRITNQVVCTCNSTKLINKLNFKT